jgi:hypothetical protein
MQHAQNRDAARVTMGSTNHTRERGEGLDRLLPSHEFSDVVTVDTDATPQRALRAAREVSAREMPLSLVLLTARALPLMIKRRRLLAPRGALWDELMRTAGFAAFEDEPGRPLLMGYIGQPWKPTAAGAPIRTRAEFLAWDEPGWAKVATAFWAEPHGARTRLLTETRIHLTDEAARHAFARYWRVVHVGSVLLRKDWLRAAKRRAERT